MRRIVVVVWAIVLNLLIIPDSPGELDLLVCGFESNAVLRCDGATGDFIGVFADEGERGRRQGFAAGTPVH